MACAYDNIQKLSQKFSGHFQCDDDDNADNDVDGEDAGVAVAAAAEPCKSGYHSRQRKIPL